MDTVLAWVVVGTVVGSLFIALKWRGRGVDSRSVFNRGRSRGSSDREVDFLRQNLRVKVTYDEATVDRLIEREREVAPEADLEELLRRAIDRWERDNR